MTNIPGLDGSADTFTGSRHASYINTRNLGVTHNMQTTLAFLKTKQQFRNVYQSSLLYIIRVVHGVSGPAIYMTLHFGNRFWATTRKLLPNQPQC